MNRPLLILFLITLSLSSWALEDTFRAVVIDVLDGNTLQLKSVADDEVLEVMLEGVDSPELGQRFGEEAKTLLAKKMMNKTVCVTITGMNRWGQKYAVVTANKFDPRIELLKKGLAWTMEKSPSAELESLRKSASEKGIGIWEEKDPTPPWVYRRQQTMTKPKSS